MNPSTRSCAAGRRHQRAGVIWGGTSLPAVSHDGEISFSRVFGAPRELVYRAFVDPDQFCQWFGPAGFSVPCETVQSDIGPIAGTGRTARIWVRLGFLDQASGRTRLELRQGLSRARCRLRAAGRAAGPAARPAR